MTHRNDPTPGQKALAVRPYSGCGAAGGLWSSIRSLAILSNRLQTPSITLSSIVLSRPNERGRLFHDRRRNAADARRASAERARESESNESNEKRERVW